MRQRRYQQQQQQAELPEALRLSSVQEMREEIERSNSKSRCLLGGLIFMYCVLFARAFNTSKSRCLLGGLFLYCVFFARAFNTSTSGLSVFSTANV